MKPNPREQHGYEEMICDKGHRLTPQRREVYDVLLADRDHPTATEVFSRVKNRMPSISLATVYNCLETLVSCGLARQINIERGASRYCPNLEEHGHFICTVCGRMEDIPLSSSKHLKRLWNLPDGITVTHSDINLHGLCASCSPSQIS